MEGLKRWNSSSVPDPGRGSAADGEMKQDAGVMNAHLCLPRLMLSVQTPGGMQGVCARARTCNCLRCSCVSAGKQSERIRTAAPYRLFPASESISVTLRSVPIIGLFVLWTRLASTWILYRRSQQGAAAPRRGCMSNCKGQRSFFGKRVSGVFKQGRRDPRNQIKGVIAGVPTCGINRPARL